MEIKVVAGDVTVLEAEALIVNLFEGVTQPNGATGAVDAALDGAITRLISQGEIKGKKAEFTLIHTLGKLPTDRIIVAGLGKREKFSPDVIRQVMGSAVRFARQLNVRNVATIVHGAGIGGMDPATSGQAIAEGVILGLYTFRRYKSKTEDNVSREVEEVLIMEGDIDKVAFLQQGIDKGRLLAEATIIARDLSNEPANVLNPTEMAKRAHQVAEAAGLEFSVLDKPEMAELGMGALLAVAAGSDQPPKLIVLRYRGDPHNKANNVALCGKGITFDSGGISIKPAQGMGDMKGDMAGGAAVIGAMKAIAGLKPKINVMGLVAATENMSGGSATRPGDVVRGMTGKTMEIDNTDAEGRLVLADAIGYARKEGQIRIVDIATLTGAAVVALGNVATAVMGNNQVLVNRVISAGNSAGEKMWQLPMFEEYRELINSDIADVKNTGGRSAGSITGAYFISEFAEAVPWVHLDIAGTSRTDKDSGYTVKGHTGVPVRTLVNLVLDLAEHPE